MDLHEREDPADNPATLTAQIRQKAEHLLQGLLDRKRDVESNPPDLPPEQLAQGRLAMEDAIASVRRMLDHLEQAQMLVREADREIAEQLDEQDEQP